MDQLAKFAAHVPGVVYQFQLWPDGRSAFPYASDGIRDIYGVEPEAVKTDAADVFAVLHPDDLDRVSASIQKSAENLSLWRERYRVCHPSGEIIWVEGESSPERLEDGSTIWHGYIRDITEQVRLEEQRAAEARKHAQVLDIASDAVHVLDKNGNVVACSQSFADHLGYTKDEALQLNVTDWEAQLKESEVLDVLQRLIKNPETFESIHRRKDGSTVPVEISGAALELEGKPYFYAAARDISERKAFEKQLKQSSARYESVVSGSKDGFAVVDVNGAIKDVNQVFVSMLGYSRDELIGMSVTDLHQGETSADVARRVAEIRQHGGSQFEADYQCKDGSLIPTEVSVSYSDLTPEDFFVFVRDIRTRRLERQLAELRASLAQEVLEGTQQGLLRIAIDSAEHATHSGSGFFHFFDSDKNSIGLSTWSSATMQGACGLKSVPSHYPLNKAGIWADAVRQQRPVFYDVNEEQAQDLKLPFGHAPVERGLFVPVMRSGQVVAILGVGNKYREYDEQDQALVQQIGDITYDYVERSRVEQQIQKMAFYDVLTGLPNRRLLTDRLEQSISLARRESTTLAVCYLDIDHFKPVNDKWGHEVGDQLLSAYTHRLKGELRDSDTLARIGGDEFVLVLTNVESLQAVDKLMQRLLDVSAKPFRIEHRRIELSASIGVTLFPNDDVDADGLIRDADHAMYIAKSRGKNTYEFFDSDESRQLQEQRLLVQELEQGIESKDLVLHFQPRIELETGDISGFEVLVRWQHPERGLLFPDQFLPAIKDTHLEWFVDQYVLQAAIATHKAWSKAGFPVSLSVNLTSSTLQMHDFPARLKALFGKDLKQIAPYFELEVLEQSSIEDTGRVGKVMLECVKLGVQFSLDDFGTGFSSLSYFHDLPIEVVKIDQSFVRNMLGSQKDYGIVEGVLRLASAIDRPVVAEGVETIELGLLLGLRGCKYAQGYGIARPMPGDQVLPWIEQWSDGKNQWSALRYEFDGPTGYSDLNTALFSYHKWSERLFGQGETEGFVAAARENMRPAAFEDWMQGLGFVHYHKLPHWHMLEDLHRLNRETLREICAEVDAAKEESLKADLRQRSLDIEKMLVQLGDEAQEKGISIWN